MENKTSLETKAYKKEIHELKNQTLPKVKTCNYKITEINLSRNHHLYHTTELMTHAKPTK